MYRYSIAIDLCWVLLLILIVYSIIDILCYKYVYYWHIFLRVIYILLLIYYFVNDILLILY